MKRWLAFGQDPELCVSLAKSLGVSPITAQILINRGIITENQGKSFLSPKLMNLTDPFELPNIKKGIERILLAKERKEKVIVYGDYDVDGTTGTSILIETLKHLGINCDYYIPCRYGEGYSLNKEAVQKIKELGANVILTVDCGISSFIEVEEANSLGMDVVVTDHHNLPDKLPNSIANIDPKLFKGPNPSKNLSGAGVAFKFAWALVRAAGIKENSFVMSLLDLAALGTIADVVPLSQENRIIAKQGMSILKGKKRPGIKALCDIAGLKKELSLRDINFGIAPRINAAGRLEHASLSVKLLISKDENQAREYASELNKINSRRQGIGEKIGADAFSKIQDMGTEDDKIIIVSGDDWHPGVIGIIASRIVDRFYKPVVMIGISDGVGRGSARSIDGVNVFEILATCRDLFNDFGGHEGAAGFEIDPEKVPELKRRLLENVNSMDIDFTPKIQIDALIDPAFATLSFIEELKLLDPIGQGNPAPTFASRGVKLTDIRQVGSDNSHLKFKFVSNKSTYEAIGFGMGNMKEEIDLNKNYDIAYSLEANEWNGYSSVQFQLIDLKPSST